MSTLKITAASLALVAALAATGCGGGGGKQQYAQNPPATLSPAPTPAPAPTSPPTESFNSWAAGVIANQDASGQPVDMNAITFVFDADTNAYDFLFVGHQ